MNPRIIYIDLHLVHEVTTPQAFDGLRMAGRKLRRADRTVATVDHNVPTSSIDDRLHIVDQIASKQIEALRKNCADFGVELYDVQVAQSRHRPHHRPRARPHQTRHDHRLRRLPHQHARGVRRFGVWNRHQRSRTRHGHPNFAAGQTKDVPNQRRRHASHRRHCKRHRPRHHRPDRHSRRNGSRHRVRRLCHPQPLDGRPHDHLQHEHRSRSTRRHDRPRRHHLCLPQRPPLLAARCHMG